MTALRAEWRHAWRHFTESYQYQLLVTNGEGAWRMDAHRSVVQKEALILHHYYYAWGYVAAPAWLLNGWGRIPLNVAVEAIAELPDCPDWWLEVVEQVRLWGPGVA